MGQRDSLEGIMKKYFELSENENISNFRQLKQCWREIYSIENLILKEEKFQVNNLKSPLNLGKEEPKKSKR